MLFVSPAAVPRSAQRAQRRGQLERMPGQPARIHFPLARQGVRVDRTGAAESEQGLVINTERLAYWQGHGAQLSPTAARLVKQAAETKAA